MAAERAETIEDTESTVPAEIPTVVAERATFRRLRTVLDEWWPSPQRETMEEASGIDKFIPDPDDISEDEDRRNLTFVNAKLFPDAWEKSRTCGRRAAAQELKRGDQADQATRPLDPSSSSTDPDPKRFKPTTMTDVENLAEQMDEDIFLRTLATSHPLDREAEENVSEKARVVRNVLRIRGEDGLTFDANEEDWPNAELVRGRVP